MKLHKREGSLGIFTSMYFILMLLVVIMACLQLKQYKAAGAYVEDAMAASGLASAVIDIKEFGSSGRVLVEDAAAAYVLYKEALATNLDLNAAGRSANPVIDGKVDIRSYIVYNVRGNDVEVSSFGPEGTTAQTVPGGLGSVTSPNGIVIESTSIYSRITFPVKGVMGVSVNGNKEKLVDITKNR